MNIKKIFLSAATCFVYVFLTGTSYAAFSLHKGVSDPGESSVSNPEYVLMRTLEIAIYGKSSDPEGISIGYTNMGAGDIYYMLSDGLVIHKINSTLKTLLGHWPLTRTPDDQQEAIMNFFVTNMRLVSDEYGLKTGSYNESALGCLWDAPLRYGDVEQDTTKEIVLLPGYDASDEIDRYLDIVIFSPQQQKVIFSSRLAREDIGPPTTEAYDNYTRIPNPGELPRIHTSDMSTGIGNGAIRAYSKLFIVDIDDNEKKDIIVWRKRYQSRTIADTVQGYKLQKELLTHYELDNGMYTAQPTDETTIRDWLNSNNLTWQKGYPSQSDCAGQEGQLIPEMHDPLLNDADVLK